MSVVTAYDVERNAALAAEFGGDGGGLAITTSRLQLVAASTVKIGRPVWAWDRRIPEAGVTLIAGREGQGKTALTCEIAARLTRGQLAGDRFGYPGDVVYIGAEDDPSTVLVPRLAAAGADLERVHFVSFGDDAPFSVVVDTGFLGDAIERLDRPFAALFVDPLDANLGAGVDTHRKSEVQRAIAQLAGLAQRHRCAAVGIAHLSKGEARDVLSRVIGSVGFTSAVRSVIGVGEHPDEPTDRIAVLAKSNMTDRLAVPAMRFRVESREVEHPDGGMIDTAGVVWLGEELGIDADSIVCLPDASERTERDEAADWLRDVLTEEAMPYAVLERMARDDGISRATLHRARKLAGVIVERNESARGRPSTWRLPVSSHGVSSPSLSLPGETKSNDGLTCPNDAVNGVSSHATRLWDETTRATE